jgi:hypothetical protein
MARCGRHQVGNCDQPTQIRKSMLFLSRLVPAHAADAGSKTWQSRSVGAVTFICRGSVGTLLTEAHLRLPHMPQGSTPVLVEQQAESHASCTCIVQSVDRQTTQELAAPWTEARGWNSGWLGNVPGRACAETHRSSRNVQDMAEGKCCALPCNSACDKQVFPSATSLY